MVRDPNYSIIKRLRDHKKMSQKAVAVRAGVSDTVVMRTEKGLHHPQLDTFIKLAHGLGCDPVLLLAAMLGGEDEYLVCLESPLPVRPVEPR